MIDSRELPPTLRQDPSVMSARIDNLRGRVESHEARLIRLESSQMVDTPVGRFPLHIVLIVLFGLAAWRPDLAAKLIGQ